MDSFIVEATKDSPLVILNPSTNIFTIEGESRPENTSKFYLPIVDWLIKFEGILYWKKNEKKESQSLMFAFKLNYFNSTSAKYIMDILLILKKYINQGYNIVIEWHHDKNNDDMKESGKEFSTMIDMKFIFVEI